MNVLKTNQTFQKRTSKRTAGKRRKQVQLIGAAYLFLIRVILVQCIPVNKKDPGSAEL